MRTTPPIPNTQRQVMLVALTVALAFIGLAVLCGLRVNGDAKFAGILLCGFCAMAGIVTALVYWPRARRFHQLFHGEPPLADWTYSDAEWAAFVRENFQRDKAGNWVLWLGVAILALLVGGGLAVAREDILFLWIALGLALILAIPAAAVPRVRRARLSHNVPRAVINRNAVWIGGHFQSWKLLAAHLISVDVDSSVSPALLNIAFRFYAQTGPQDEAVRVPVPAGQESAAETVVAELRRQIK